MREAAKDKPRMICGDCTHLGVTYEPRQPWRCARFGFKSRDLPARVVLHETGMECAYYTPSLRGKSNA